MRKKNWKSNIPAGPKTDTPENRTLAFNYSLKYLSFRGRSVKEIFDYLKEKNFIEDTINFTIKKLVDLKFVNDEEFGRTWIESRQRNKGKSKLVLKSELKMKGLSDDVIQPLLQEAADDIQTARVLFEKKKRILGNIPKLEFRKKMGSFLQRRGYNYEVIKKLFEELT